jgi:menaquinone-specific isochorismate synthase
MALADRFGFFDPTQPYLVTYSELPHWEQEGATYFITFRTKDSLPESVKTLLQRERDDWLKRQGIDPDREDWQATLRQRPHEFQRAFHREYVGKLEAALDRGLGACVLRDRALAQIIADSLLFFDGQRSASVSQSDSVSSEPVPSREVRYNISDFVVMPNHVHVLVCFLSGVRMLAQCRSWKHFTAVKINAALGAQGEFWQPESFDHLVRDADHFERFRRYIADNRMKAHLKADEGIHYQCPE